LICRCDEAIRKDFWTAEEDTLSLVDQIGIALESARLYEASQFQVKETFDQQIGSKLQESLMLMLC
jgi:GAF domain-containing protein